MTEQATIEYWISIEQRVPPENLIVDTAIIEDESIINEQQLKRKNRLWFIPDGGIHVGQTPTHWRTIQPPHK